MTVVEFARILDALTMGVNGIVTDTDTVSVTDCVEVYV